MCGLCGLIDRGGGPIDRGVVEAMTRRIAHRGPDDEGVYVAPGAGLGHRRLSIIDLSAAGHQPMASSDGSLVAVYNGEIYNYREVREELARAGARFRTATDTEVAIEAYRRWGVEGFARLNGMFAIALWSPSRRELVLARDRFGIKPLYYLERGGMLAFGSEIKAILASGLLDRQLDPAALHEYLYYGAALGERTMFAGVRKLPPGQFARFGATGLTTGPYVSAFDPPPVEGATPDLVARLRTHLEAAVRRHLIADVPVGVFLSGGIDSSTITAYASRNTVGRLKTFSVEFDFLYGPSEIPKARRIAAMFGTEHHEMKIVSHDLPAVIESLVDCHDEPFGDAADIPLYLLAREIKGSIKVVLQGDGGDEMFGGYRKYAVLAWARFWRAAAAVAHPVRTLFPRTPVWYQRRRFLQAMGQADPAMRMALLMTDEWLEFPPTDLLAPDLRAAVAPHDPFRPYRELQRRFGHLDPVQRMLYADAAFLLPDIFLEKVDKSTMAHGLEVRVPFLDHELAAFALGLPSGLKVKHGRKKWILREALRGVLPDDILDGPKQGFGVPFAKWLKGPLYDYLSDRLLGPSAPAREAFDPAALGRVLTDHRDGIRDSGFLLWKLLNLALWSDRYKVRLRV